MIQDRPICQQCTSGHRQYECQWDPAPLSKTEKLEARVRELEELVESNWGTHLSTDPHDNNTNSQSGECLDPFPLSDNSPSSASVQCL